jgi:hypothetical protein
MRLQTPESLSQVTVPGSLKFLKVERVGIEVMCKIENGGFSI